MNTATDPRLDNCKGLAFVVRQGCLAGTATVGRLAFESKRTWSMLIGCNEEATAACKVIGDNVLDSESSARSIGCNGRSSRCSKVFQLPFARKV
jgi:hypothetical protein